MKYTANPCPNDRLGLFITYVNDGVNCAASVEQVNWKYLPIGMVSKHFNKESEILLALLLVRLLPWLKNASFLAWNFMFVIPTVSFLIVAISPQYFLLFSSFSFPLLQYFLVSWDIPLLYSFSCLRGPVSHINLLPLFSPFLINISI